jgi:hypothetical protein
VDRDDRPRLEAAGLPEHDLGFSALVGRTLLDDLGQEVVQEVGSEIEARLYPPRRAAVRASCPLAEERALTSTASLTAYGKFL